MFKTIGIARLYCNKQLEDASTIHKLNKIIYFASLNEYAASYDRNLNNLSFNELDKTFAPIIAKYDDGESTYKIYDKHTLKPFAPWKVTELKGSYGFVYYVVDLEGDNETYYLDKQANLYVKAEAKKMKLIKENPYLKK